MRRFAVASVAGYPITSAAARRGGTRHPGLTALVVDTPRNCATVAQYRSEDVLGGSGKRGGERLGILGALQAAEAEAARLNALLASEDD